MCKQTKPPLQSEVSAVAEILLDSTLTWIANYRKENPDLTEDDILRMIEAGKIKIDCPGNVSADEFARMLKTLVRWATPQYVTT